MADEEKDKRLDDLLDSLLSQYSSADPRPGFETRVLAAVKEAAEKKPGYWNLRWLAAGAAGVAAVAVIVFVLFSRTATPRPQPPVVSNRKTPATRVSPPKATPNVVRAAQPTPKTTPVEIDVVAKRDVFPTPTPLSQQEILLLRYMAGTPHEELIAQSRPDAPPADLEQDTPPPRDLTQVPQRSSNTK
jgi:hypothetical protein